METMKIDISTTDIELLKQLLLDHQMKLINKKSKLKNITIIQNELDRINNLYKSLDLIKGAIYE